MGKKIKDCGVFLMALKFYMENNKILYGYSLINILWAIKDVSGEVKKTELIVSEANLWYLICLKIPTDGVSSGYFLKSLSPDPACRCLNAPFLLELGLVKMSKFSH